MTSRQVVIISEPVPRFQVWSSEEAQIFVFDFASHQNRLGPDDAKTPMCRAVDPNYLQMLLEWPKQPDWIEVVESLPKAGGQGAEVRVDLQTPFKPANFHEFAVGKSARPDLDVRVNKLLENPRVDLGSSVRKCG